MFVSGLGTANPPQRYSKAEYLQAFKASEWFLKLDRRAHIIAETVLTKDNGIAYRSLAVESLSDVFQIDPDTLHARFLANAPDLAAAAGRSALQEAMLTAAEIDGLVVSTCTGYLCPGLTSYMVERLGLRADILAFDLVGQGCAAALPNWRLADAMPLRRDRCRRWSIRGRCRYAVGAGRLADRCCGESAVPATQSVRGVYFGNNLATVGAAGRVRSVAENRGTSGAPRRCLRWQGDGDG